MKIGLILSFVLNILLFVLIGYLFYSGKIGEAEISIPGGTTVKLKGGGKKSIIENIEALFSDGKISQVVINYIADNKKIYKVTDHRNIDAFAQLCEADNPIKFSSCLRGNPVLMELRRRSAKRLPPFQYETVLVDIGFAESKDEFVTACKNGSFEQGSLVEISSPDFSKKIERVVRGYYNCTRKPYPDIQLNTKDRKEIFGDIWHENKKQGYVTIIESRSST